MRGIRPPLSGYFTLAAGGNGSAPPHPWHGRTVQILVSLSSLQRGFWLVTREDTPRPQLREHGVQSVVWRGHFFSFRRLQSEGVSGHASRWVRVRGGCRGEDKSLTGARLLLPQVLEGGVALSKY